MRMGGFRGKNHKGVYRLKQTGINTNKQQLNGHLAKYGYPPTPQTTSRVHPLVYRLVTWRLAIGSNYSLDCQQKINF